jgi:hypothetical protein
LNRFHVSISLIDLALQATVNFEQNVFPFARKKHDEKLSIIYLIEPPESLTLAHKDSVKIIHSLLAGVLSSQPSQST